MQCEVKRGVHECRLDAGVGAVARVRRLVSALTMQASCVGLEKVGLASRGEEKSPKGVAGAVQAQLVKRRSGETESRTGSGGGRASSDEESQGSAAREAMRGRTEVAMEGGVTGEEVRD